MEVIKMMNLTDEQKLQIIREHRNAYMAEWRSKNRKKYNAYMVEWKKNRKEAKGEDN